MLKVLSIYLTGVLFVFCVFSISCSTPEKNKRVVVKKGDGNQDDEDFADVQGIVDGNCNVSGCHDGGGLRKFDASNFKDSAALTRIENGSMPPKPRTLDPDDKSALIAYLEN